MSLVNLLRETGRAIAYRPKLAKVLGGVVAEIFFEQIFYWQGKSNNELGVYKTQDELEEEIGLSRKEQETARKKLREIGVLIETHKRLEHRIYYKINEARLNEILTDLISQIDDNSGSDNGSLANAQNEHYPMPKSDIREEPKVTFVNTLDYNNRLHTNNNPLPPNGKSPDGDHTVLQNDDEVKSKKRKPTKPKNDIDYQAVLDFYNEQNELHGKRLPSAIDLNDKRKRGIVKILNLLKPSTLDGFKNYIEAFFERATEFYFGGNNRNWRASFDYLLREDTLTKVREEAL